MAVGFSIFIKLAKDFGLPSCGVAESRDRCAGQALQTQELHRQSVAVGSLVAGAGCRIRDEKGHLARARP